MVIYWVGESLVHVNFDNHVSFRDALFPTDRHELTMRILTFLVIFVISVISETIIIRLNLKKKRLRALLDVSNERIWEINNQGEYTYANHRTKDILGYEPEEIIGKSIFDLMPNQEAKRVWGVFAEARRKKESLKSLETVNIHKDGTEIHLEMSATPFFNREGNLKGYHGMDHDVTAKKHYEKQLLLTQNVFQNSIEGISITNSNGEIERVNRAFTEITGYTEAEVLGKNPRILKSNHHDVLFYQLMWKSLIEKGEWSGEIWNRKKDGEAYPEWLSISAIRDQNGETTHYVALFHDITDEKNNEQRLQHMAYHDALTELPNRKLYQDRLAQALVAAKRKKSGAALFFLDIDNFKNVNDTLGHNVGDKLLILVKERILSVCRLSDTLARFGGDEFVLILSELPDRDMAISIARRILSLFKEPFHLAEKVTYTGISIGIAFFPEDGEDLVTLEKNADLALYKAKKSGKMSYALYTDSLNATISRRAQLEDELRSAVGKKEFQLYYQPKVDIEKHEVISFEALLRWELNGQFISPEEFIPLAEETGLIVPLGRWVLEQASLDLKYFKKEINPEITLSVNLSRKQFQDPLLPAVLIEITKESQISPADLLLEITENVIMDEADRAVEIMKGLTAYGFQFSMDDFGTGYSSLGYLKKFPLFELKIDKTFIREVPADPRDTAITKAVIALAENMGLQLVTEGVETEQQLDFLKRNNCRIIQGYYFSKPVPRDQAVKKALELKSKN